MLGADGALVKADEGLRETTMESLAKLKPAFRPRRRAAGSPPATRRRSPTAPSAVLIMSEEKAAALGLTPRARFVDFALAGADPRLMLTAPIPATAKVLERSGMSIDDIDLVEINEAFASVVLAWEKELHPDMDKVNVNGGAIALGHPLGCSGARLMTHAAQRARAHRRPLRPADDVRGRRHGQRHDHRAARLTPAFRPELGRTVRPRSGRKRSGAAGQKVPQQVVAGSGQDALGVELHALDVVVAVAHAHDRAVGRGGGDLRTSGRVAGSIVSEW